MNSEKLQKARDYEARYAAFVPDSERPAFHLTPRIGWMNDPNGFSFYKGEYHMFYQYNPYETKWGPMHWGHATSSDLVRWTFQPCVMAPDKDYDNFGCYSGSAIELPNGQHLLMYTGVNVEIRDDGRKNEIQTQCLAIGDGTSYEKIPENPVISSKDLPEGGSAIDFRDPKIWREEDGSYACVIGNRPADGSGSVLLYRSADAFHWKFDCILDQCWNEFGKMWECPDFFALDGQDVILTSPQDMQPSGLEFHNGNATLCLIGKFDRETKHFERERVQSIDYGLDFYATQTILTPDGRRVMAAWMQNWDSCYQLQTEQSWFGQLILPRELSIRNGRLIQNPIREIEKYRGRRVRHKIALSGEETSLRGVYGRVLDMTITVHSNTDNIYQLLRIKLANGGQHYTLITYKPATSILKLDRNHSGFCRDIIHERKCVVSNRRGDIKLRILLDRFSVEVFVNDGEQSLSATIYTPQTADGISFEVQGQAQLEVEKYDLAFTR